MADLNIGIASPPSGNVSGGGGFKSWGNYDVAPSQNVTVIGWITNASTGATVADGTFHAPPSGYNWGLEFTGLAINTPYVEHVQATAADGTVANATVSITCVE